MKRFLATLLSVLPLAGAFAANALLSGSTDFDDPTLWGKTVTWGLDDNGEMNTARTHWYVSGGGRNGTVIQQSGLNASGYLVVDADGTVSRTIATTPETGPLPSGAAGLSSALFFDSRVFFEESAYPEFTAIDDSDKVVCWLYRADDDAATNVFMVAAAQMEVIEGTNTVVGTTNYVTTLTKVDPTVEHRLMIRACVENEVVGFRIYVDDVLVKTEDGLEFFPSRVQKAEVYSLGFSGSGQADFVNFTRANPQEEEDYDKVDLSMLREAVEFTVSGYAASQPLVNFPMLIRIAAADSGLSSAIKGFSYEQVKANGSDIRFTDENGKLLSYEIDTWNTDGESLIWVRVPYFRNGTKVVMHWNLEPATSLSASTDPLLVWNDYAGVWHFAETIDAAHAARTHSKDSTKNGMTAAPVGGAKANSAAMVSTDGPIGNGRVNETRAVAGGNALQLSNSEYLKLGGSFSFSGWVKCSDLSADSCLVSRKNEVGDANGFALMLTSGVDGNKAKVYGADAEPGSATIAPAEYTPDELGWVYLSVSYENGLARVCAFSKKGPSSGYVTEFEVAAPTDNDLPIFFGGDADLNARNLFAAMDEFRLRKSPVSALWAKAEFEQITKGNYIWNAGAITKGLYNTWVREPSVKVGGIEAESWSTTDAAKVTIDAGMPFYGLVFEEYYDVDGQRLAARPALDVPGTYRAVFRASDGIHVDLVREITFVIYDLQGYTQIPGYDRVMLFNSDYTPAGEVCLQGYNDVDTQTNHVWGSAGAVWENVDDYPFVRRGTTHGYHEPETGRALWRFERARLGNLFAEDGSVYPEMHALPWNSPTARRFDDSEKQADRSRYAGTLIFQNVSTATDPEHPAAAYSPVYTNGIGTVYFDAVNAYLGYSATLQVQVRRGEAAAWEPLTADVCAVIGGVRDASLTKLGQTNIVLNMDEGGTDDCFFRVRAKVNSIDPYLQVRIVRTDVDLESWSEGEDEPGLVILDNIIVSPPAMGVEIEQFGESMKEGDPLLGGWWKGGFDVPYPGVGDVVHARLKMKFIVSGTNKVDESFVPSAVLCGRFRYLNQEIGEWKNYALHPDGDNLACFVSDETLSFDAPGDFEYYYKVICNAPFYVYHDYANLAGWAWPAGEGERRGDQTIRAKDDGLYTASLSPALGRDYFVRIRDGKSDVESVQVLLSGKRNERVSMELISDHVWRALVPATNKIGKVSFSFREVLNVRKPGAYWVEASEWAGEADDEDGLQLPYTGETKKNAPQPFFMCDGATQYVEFRYNDETHEFSLCHAEYQNFNQWHDANRNGLFLGKFAVTSGVTQVTMTTTNAPIASWPLLKSTDYAWNEDFTLSNYLDPAYPKNEELMDHRMPHQWYGYFGMFTDEKYVGSSLGRTNESGLAWQMQGRAYGRVQYNNETSGPSGIDRVTFRAHLAQSIEFNDFSVWNGDGANNAANYTFFIPALMSDNNCTDLAPGATMSLIGYYRAHVGGYEFRVEKIYNEGVVENYRFSIYKWREEGYAIQPELLGSTVFSKVKFSNASTSAKPAMYGFYLSIGEDDKYPGATTIIGGLGTGTKTPTAPGNFSGQPYNSICCVDTNAISGVASPRYTCGAFGVLSKNCRGLFLSPAHYSENVKYAKLTWTTPKDESCTGYAAAKNVTFPGEVDSDVDKLVADWDFVPGRIEKYVNIRYDSVDRPGLRTPTNVSQTVDVLLKTRGAGDGSWVCATNIAITGYGFEDYSATIQTTPDSTVMLRTGKATTDVTIHNITQTGWRGEDIANINGKANDFVYTQTFVTNITERKVTSRVAILQPSRALSTKPLSIRSPILKGMGMIGFTYRDLQPGCEVWVQMSTNNVSANLSTLNQTLSEGSGAGQWETIRAFTYDELMMANEQSVYMGLHTELENPNALRGVFRLVIAPSVVATAADEADRLYGSITITDVWVQDEPGIDTKSWWGWNIRAAGDANDSEGRMYLPDGRLTDPGSALYGLSGALNNSTTVDIEGDPNDYAQNNPFIQSPTCGLADMGGGVSNRVGIGLVRFRARLYDRSSTVPARVAIYGVLNGNTMDWGEPLTNLVVTSTTFREYEYRVGGKGRKFAAVRLVVDGVVSGSSATTPQRVLFDEVVLSEKADAGLSFVYARPFRTGLRTTGVITDILTREQQPLVGESWGIQARLQLPRLGNQIDTNRGFRVTMRYFVGSSPWGFENWATQPSASAETELMQVGDFSELVFRSTTADLAYRDTVVKAQDKAGQVVQYVVTAYFYAIGENVEYSQPIEWSKTEGIGWTNPSWYAPIDYNNTYVGKSGSFSPYTILDTVSPGRAWINEANYNDGPRKQNGGYVPTEREFIELAVPAGVDMSGWRVKVTDMDHNLFAIATLGKNGVASSKKTAHKSGDYDFLVLQSPDTKSAGGIKDPDGNPAADGTWTDEDMSSNFKAGNFRYGQPYEISLYRKTGILEHQFVIQGTNEYARQYYGYQYAGTNLVAELNDLVPELPHFYAGEDLARWTNETDYASLGVTGSHHGEEGGWAAMPFTVGRLNENQAELKDWYLKPNGTNIWVYTRVVGPHLEQNVGGDTSRDTFVIVPAGKGTNITYTTAKWYEIASLTQNGVTNEAVSGATGSYTLELKNLREDVEIVATEGIRRDIGIDSKDRYAPAIMKWLENGYADGQEFVGDKITTNNFFKGLLDSCTVTNLTIKELYWLDLDPTMGGWWVRGGVSDYKGEKIERTRTYNAGTAYEYDVVYTNHLIQVKLYVSNDVDHTIAPFAPKRLQGLGGEQSDTYQGQWTSVNFKVTARLNNKSPHNAGFLPFRWFVFGADSFYPAASVDPLNPPFTARIEILDPFSESSPGYSYGWYGYGMFDMWFRWKLNDEQSFSTIEMLNKNSTYGYPYK